MPSAKHINYIARVSVLSVFWVPLSLSFPSWHHSQNLNYFFLLNCCFNYHIVIFSFVLFFAPTCQNIFLTRPFLDPPKTSLLFMYSCENSFLNYNSLFFQREYNSLFFSKEKTPLPNSLPNLEYIYFTVEIITGLMLLSLLFNYIYLKSRGKHI